jgi:hypothetical protein
MFDLPIASEHYTRDELREIDDPEELQDAIDQYDVIIALVKNQLEYRTDVPDGWEARATSALTANQILRTTAVQQLNRVSGRGASNQQIQELMVAQSKLAKEKAKENTLERGRQEVAGRKIKAVKQVTHLASQLSYDRCFQKAARQVLSGSPEILEQIQTVAQEIQDIALQRELKRAGIEDLEAA